jgi:hypothetical protein
MNDAADAALRSRLAESDLDRSGAAFTASVLGRLGARRRRRDFLLRLVLGLGLLASFVLLAPAITRACADLSAAPNAAVRLAAALVLLAGIVIFPRAHAR